MSHASPLIERDIHAYLKEHEEKELLRFITCGSVDDGKSTLIGRLLHDSKLIFEDQLAALTRDSSRFGTTGDAPDLALLVDGLQAEREQGITIDVAYRYFSTEKRKFIIADTPGHEQYTRNMATGASTASLAVILVDASKGVTTQTKRHTTIVSLLGIRRIVVAVNKMDLVDFDEGAFRAVQRDYQALLSHLDGQAQVHYVPMSALQGDNVVNASERTPWYQGGSLMHVLETVDLHEDRNFTDLRFPVQYVNRPHAGFRGYAGTIASGTVRVGDEVMVLPSRRHGRVARIVTYDGDLQEARAPQAVTLTLDDDLDVGRGDVLAHPGNAPSVGEALDATLVWMSDEPLRPGKLYELQLGTARSQAVVRKVHHGIDVNSGERVEAGELALNEIGSCRLSLTSPLAFDPYATLPATGSFVLVDRATFGTVGAGMIERPARPEQADKATNVTWHETHVSKAIRAAQKGQKPCVLWFTGLSGAGKSTIANAVEQRLTQMGHHTYLLDGDNVRHGLNRDLGFGDDDRVENIRRIGEVSKLFVDAGLIVLTAFISPFRSDRRLVREMFEPGEFLEVFVDTPLDVAEQRDPKGLYARARRGEIANFTGIDSPYERPAEPEVRLEGGEKGVDALVDELVDYLLREGVA